MKNSVFLKIIVLSALFAPFTHTMQTQKENTAFFAYSNPRAIHHAVANNNLKLVQTIIEEINPGDLEITTEDQETPLHIAARHGHTKIVKYLLSKDANTEAKNKFDETPLHIAIRNGHTGIVKLLLHSMAALDATNKKRETALHIATLKNNTAIIKILLDRIPIKKLQKIYLEKRTKEGLTALHIACYYGKKEAAKLLIAYGADIEAIANKKNKVQNSCDPCGGCGCGCDDDDELCEGGGCFSTSCCEGSCNCKPYGNGETPLMLAVIGKHKTIVEFLLSKKANIHATDDHGETVVHLVTNTEIAKILLDHGANANKENTYGENPLYTSNNPEITKLLLAHGAKINTIENSRSGLSVLHDQIQCCTSPSTKNIKILLEHGANVEKKDACNETPLVFAIVTHGQDEKPKVDIICLLIKRGADLEKLKIEYDQDTNECFIFSQGDNFPLDKNIENILGKYLWYKEHFMQAIEKYNTAKENKAGLLRHIKKLMYSDHVPTYIKKIALPIIIKECPTREEIFECFTQVSFDSTFLTYEYYKGALKYAIRHNIKDVNNRTILEAAIILNKPEIIPAVLEYNETALTSNLCKAYLYFLINNKFNPEHKAANNLIKILRNVNIRNEAYVHLRDTLIESLTALHELKKEDFVLPKELVAKIMGYLFVEDAPTPPEIDELIEYLGNN